MNLEKLSVNDLISLYSNTIKELKKRDVIRTKNVLGEIAEYLAIHHYCNTPGLPNLQAAPVGTENIDAISRSGERYSIKATSGSLTGVFYGLEPKGSSVPDKQKFEYLIICQFDDEFQLKAIYQLDWESFLKHKKWHSRMKAWNITLSKSVIADAKVIYKSRE